MNQDHYGRKVTKSNAWGKDIYRVDIPGGVLEVRVPEGKPLSHVMRTIHAHAPHYATPEEIQIAENLPILETAPKVPERPIPFLAYLALWLGLILFLSALSVFMLAGVHHWLKGTP